MKHTTIHPIIKSRFEKIEAALISAVIQFKAEDIHAFRVEVKKLRAFLQLADEKKQLSLPKRLHKFYRMAGHIRNLELQQQRIHDAFRHKSQLPQSYLYFLGTETATACQVAGGYAKKKLSIGLELDYLLDHAPRHLEKTDIHHFIRHTEDRLRTSIALPTPLSDEVLHDLRKCLKDLQYNRSYVKKEAADILPDALLKSKDQLTHLTEALGRYQDLRAGLLLLAPTYLQQVKEEKETALLETLRTRWEKDKQAAGIRLHTLLSKMLSHTPAVPVAAEPVMETPFTT